jgi:hypothetical protein
VLIEHAGAITLHDPIDFRGRLIDSAGLGISGRTISLDRDGGEARTGADGDFLFPRVKVGDHGLRLERGPTFHVHLEPGSTESFLVAWEDVETPVELVAGDRPLPDAGEGAWLGIRTAAGIREFKVRDGRGSVRGLAPGSYLLLLRGALAVRVDVAPAAERLRVELGSAELRVRGPTGTRIYLLPADSEEPAASGEFAQLLAGRVSAVAIPEGGELRVAPIREGRYEIGIDREGILGPVQVSGSGSVVVLE